MQLLDIRKDAVHQVAQELGVEQEIAEVKLAIDISGSMRQLYENGTVQKIIERLAPLAMEFDDNGAMELFLFHDGAYQHENDVTEQNLPGFVRREIMGKYSYGGRLCHIA